MKLLLRVSVCLAVMFSALALSAPPAALASGIEPASLPVECRGVALSAPNRWIAIWNFDGSNTGCMLYTGNAAPGQTPPISGYRLIDCSTAGTVSYAAGEAIFGGNGYLRCSFTPQPAAAPNTFVEYPDLWIYAKLKLAPGVGEFPIFYHPSASMGVIRPVSTGQASLVWSFQHPDRTVSNGKGEIFEPTSPMALKVATRCTDANGCAKPEAATYAHTPYVNGNKQASQTAPAPVYFRISATTIYIGYSPITQQYLRGNLNMLVIDPTQVGRDPTGD